jgi:hypothetical protein
MTKVIQDLDGPRIGINSSFDMYAKLLHESARLKADWRNSFDTFNFLVTAWHLFHDWPKCEPKDALTRLKRQRTQIPGEMIFILDIVKDITNGSKHFQLDPSAAKARVVSEIHTGFEVSYYQLLVRRRLPGLDARSTKVGLKGYFSIVVLHNILMRYFEWVFDDAENIGSFPKCIVDAVKYCDIESRPLLISESAKELLQV